MKPCPFCGEAEGTLEALTDFENQRCVRCGACGAQGPPSVRREWAVNYWEARAATEPLEAEIVRYYQRENEREAEQAKRLIKQIEWMGEEIKRLKAKVGE